MMRDALLGIDAGTSSVKVCAFSFDGVMLKKTSASTPLMSQVLGQAEIDVLEYWRITQGVIQEITSDKTINIVGIGISSTCPTTIALNRNNEAVRPGITYLDNRAIQFVKDFANKFSDQGSFVESVGNRPATSTCSMANALWLRDNEETNWGKTERIGMLNSYLAFKLSGNGAIDITQASYTGLFNLRNPNSWDDELIKIAGFPKEKLLPVVAPFTKIGTIQKSIGKVLGIKQGVPVALGSADTAAAAFAIGFIEPETAFESVGTSGVISLLLDHPVFSPIFMNRCHIYPGYWLAHGAMSMMGGALDWLRKNIWTDFDNPGEMDSCLKLASPGANGVVFLPYLAGERSPIWDANAVGVWYGMTIKTDRVDLIEAVYESGAFALKQILDYSESILNGRRIESIIAVGNGTRSEHWNQLKSDVLQATYIPTVNADAAAFGAAMLGGIAADVFDGVFDRKIPKISPHSKIYHPRGGKIQSEYQRSFNVYKSLYPALKKIMGGNI